MKHKPNATTAKPLVSDVILAAQYVSIKKTLLRHVREDGGPSLCGRIVAEAFAGDYQGAEAATCKTCLRRLAAKGGRS